MNVLLLLGAVLPMLASVQGEGEYFIVAPNVIRVDVDETILINVHDTPDDFQVPVTLYFLLPGSDQRFSETTVIVTKDVSQKATIGMTRKQLMLAPADQRSITLVASANTDHLHIDDRRIIPLSYQSGFVFIQTDKPLYTPSQRVDIRVVALDQDMAPSILKLQVDIVNPAQIIVHRYDKTSANGFVTLQFDFPAHPVFGNWTAVVRYGYQMEVNTSVQFEVKEYVLPSFYVEINTQKNYIVPDTQNLITYVNARYTFGDPVTGGFLVKYGVFTDEGNLTILRKKQGTLNNQGTGYADLVMSDVTMIDWAERFMGKRLLIQAFVTDGSSGEIITANNTMVTFSRTPYKFNWDLTQRYFKKGLPFAVKANLQFMSGLPAASVPVSVSAIVQRENGKNLTLGAAQVNGLAEPEKKLSGPQGEVDFTQNIPSDATSVTLHLITEDTALSDGVQSSDTFNVLPQESSNGEFLLLRLSSNGNRRQTQEVGLESSIEVQLTHPTHANILHIFVIAGGRIIYQEARTQLISNTGIQFLITHEMVPSSRVVAYYKSTETDQIIADALYMEVQGTCENGINLRFENIPKDLNGFKTDGSNKNVELRVGANEYTTIGLLAVDEAVYALRNYHRLTQKKVLKRMAGYDLGCGPGGGQTVADIFKNAGVTILSNFSIDVAQSEGCERNERRRRRRSISKLEYDQIVNKYQGNQRNFCEKGLKNLASTEKEMSCFVRARKFAKRKSLFINSTQIRTFLECCEKMEEYSRGRSGIGYAELDFAINLDDVIVRSNFPESWMFTEVETGGNDYVRYQTTLPDSITTWVVEAIGISEDFDMCVADPVKLQVRPPFFLDVHMPRSVRRFEQIEIIVSIFNYEEVDLEVIVKLRGVEGLCSDAQPGTYSKGIRMAVHAKQQETVKFVLVPLEAKAIPVEVVAVTNSSRNYSDGVIKVLNVLQEGFKQRETISVMVDPQKTRVSTRDNRTSRQKHSFQHTQTWPEEGVSKQVDVIRYTLNSEAVPGSHQVHVSLIGNMMGSVIETVLNNLDDLLRIPKGCGEQTMLYLAPNVYIYTYLKLTKQFTPAKEISSMQYIGDGVANELTHRRSDGSFSVWGENPSYPSSTWLTAFVSKVMCQAKQFAFIDETITCEAMRWLIEETQVEDGSFQEVYRVHHQEMTGGVQGEASLTAYVLISLLECNCKIIDKSQAVEGARTFLEQELPALTRPYAIAITAYALAKAQSSLANEAIDMLKEIVTYDTASNFRHWGSDDSSFGDGPKPYWYSNQPTAIDVETTSYALLALLEMEDIHYTHAIVNWLTDQSNYDGGFVSTQDTVIALQALSQYGIQSQQNYIDISCRVTCEETKCEKTFQLTRENAIVRQHANIEVPESVPDFHVFFDSQGQGIGQLKFESVYHIPEPDSRKCDFELILNGVEGRSSDGEENGEVTISDEGDSRSRVGRLERSAFNRGRASTDGDESTYGSETARNGRAGGSSDDYIFEYDIQVRYLRKESTGMAIVDVGLYTGYEPIHEELMAEKMNSKGLIQRFEVTDRSVIFYLSSIKSSGLIRIRFATQRKFHVGLAQPVAVHVYDFYNPTEECVKFIHPQVGVSSMLRTLCEGDTCVCAAGRCADNPSTDPNDFDVSELKENACLSVSHFAYQVEMISVKRKSTFQYFTMRIIDVLKHGLDNVTQNATRTFWKSMSCGLPNIRKKTYLVIGSGGLAYKDDNDVLSYKYVIDKTMSFYEWPTGTKATRNKKWKTISKNLAALKNELSWGCPF